MTTVPCSINNVMAEWEDQQEGWAWRSHSLRGHMSPCSLVLPLGKEEVRPAALRVPSQLRPSRSPGVSQPGPWLNYSS